MVLGKVYIRRDGESTGLGFSFPQEGLSESIRILYKHPKIFLRRTGGNMGGFA
jgi:hypothetical protein